MKTKQQVEEDEEIKKNDIQNTKQNKNNTITMYY